ncbi:hypothetical protein MIR68_008693 [Amoeboaphelidium protococcarum]|nr:hypothetical protein MIR68_008693 [Amoeboaphelidium protococcarum]
MFYALLFSYLVLWANCLFPAIQSMRIGAFMKSDITAVLRNGNFVNDKHVFDLLMHEMTGGDATVKEAIKQIAKNTMDGLSFSLDPIIEHAKQMAPRMAENSRDMISRFTQGANYADAARKLVSFVTKATGSTYEADQVLDILDSTQDDPRETTHRLISFMSKTNDFVSDCIAQTRNLLIDSSIDYKRQREIEKQEIAHKVYLFNHPFEHPSALYRHFALATLVIVGLWLASLILQCVIPVKSVKTTLNVFRLLAAIYCFVYLCVMASFTGSGGVALLPIIGSFLVFFPYCLFELSALDSVRNSDRGG